VALCCSLLRNGQATYGGVLLPASSEQVHTKAPSSISPKQMQVPGERTTTFGEGEALLAQAGLKSDGRDGQEDRLMRTVLDSGLSLFFDEDERDAAVLIGDACEKSVRLIRTHWRLDTPEDCSVYVMTSWVRFVFQSAPLHWRILLVISMPFWYFRVRKVWKFAGGWAQRYGARRAVGVKPPRLMQPAETGMGNRIFIERDLSEKVQHVTCHELVHAFAAHLRLPMWLNEGLAMLTVDRYHGAPTVRDDTIDSLSGPSPGARPSGYRKARSADADALVRHYVRGYWLTRFVEDTKPELMKDLLSRRHSHGEIEDKTAGAFGMRTEQFWKEIDSVIVSHFTRPRGTNDVGRQ
jgi:hypothetical protein